MSFKFVFFHCLFIYFTVCVEVTKYIHVIKKYIQWCAEVWATNVCINLVVTINKFQLNVSY